MGVAAARVRFVAQIHQLEATCRGPRARRRPNAAVKIDTEEAIDSFEHTLWAANAAPGELHRDDGRLRGQSGLQPFHQRGVARDLMVSGDRAVDDAERARHLVLGQPERAAGGRGGPEVAKERLNR